MLILTRKIGERIVIGKDVVVRVTRISGGSVRLAFDAPEDVKIIRGELVEGEEKAA